MAPSTMTTTKSAVASLFCGFCGTGSKPACQEQAYSAVDTQQGQPRNSLATHHQHW